MIFGFGNFDVVKGSGTGVTEERLAEVLTQEKANGTMDDIRIYATTGDFPRPTGTTEKPVEGVQYVANDTGIEYIWTWDDPVAKTSGAYKEINTRATDADCSNIVK